jgi:hypothetical protein
MIKLNKTLDKKLKKIAEEACANILEDFYYDIQIPDRLQTEAFELSEVVAAYMDMMLAKEFANRAKVGKVFGLKL